MIRDRRVAEDRPLDVPAATTRGVGLGTEFEVSGAVPTERAGAGCEGQTILAIGAGASRAVPPTILGEGETVLNTPFQTAGAARLEERSVAAEMIA